MTDTPTDSPNVIPQDVWDTALRKAELLNDDYAIGAASVAPVAETIARAILADRSRAASLIESQAIEIRELRTSADAARQNFHTMQAAANELRKERDEARQIVRDIGWMAVRYADGRSTYAPGLLNDALRKGYDAGWLEYKSTNVELDPQYARDGMSPEWKARALNPNNPSPDVRS